MLNERLPVVKCKQPQDSLRDLRHLFTYEHVLGTDFVRLRHIDVLPKNTEAIEVKMSGALTHTLGFPMGFHQRNGYKVTAPANVQGHLPHMRGDVVYPCEKAARHLPEMINILCNLVDSEFTAWGRKERILHSTTMSNMFDQRPEVLCYKRIAVTRLDQMIITVLDADGEEMVFDKVPDNDRQSYLYNIHIGLHFKRAKVRD